MVEDVEGRESGGRNRALEIPLPGMTRTSLMAGGSRRPAVLRHASKIGRFDHVHGRPLVRHRMGAVVEACGAGSTRDRGKSRVGRPS